MRRIVLALVLGALVSASVASAAVPLRQDTIPSYGISVKVPSMWARTPAASFSKQVVYAAVASTTHEGFRANLNLIAQKAGPGVTLRSWLLADGGPRYLKLGKLAPVTINGVDGIRYESTKLIVIAGEPLLTLQYAFSRNGRLFLFTYTALASDRGRIMGTLEASAHTIQFGL
jgi:hypothetical protein